MKNEEEMNMTMDEKFNQIYQTIVNKNADALELARREAQSEEL